jgi:uncharacterized protein (UPF0332 family)
MIEKLKLTDDERKAIVALRLDRAKETLTEAKGNIEMCYWRSAVNRLYYACYYAVSALLLQYGYSAQTHSGTIALLGKHFVATEIISRDMGKFYGQLFDFRQTGDYDDWKIVEDRDVKPLIKPAEQFIDVVIKIIQNRNP